MCSSRKNLLPLLMGVVPALVPQAVYAAACCASSSAAPTLITGDHRAQVSLITSQGSVVGDAPDEGIPVFRSDGDSETTRTARLEGALLLSDRTQLGLSLPLVRSAIDRPGTRESTTQWGDLKVTTAYEVLPEWSYSVWRPQGTAFLQLLLPTGRSIYDPQPEKEKVGLATGQGFYTMSSGILFTKRWGNWDVLFSPEIRHSLSRSWQAISFSEGWGASLGVGVGFSPRGGDLRLGLRVQPNYEAPRKVTSSGIETVTGYRQTWDTSLESSYMVTSTWTVLAAYTDQTLVGPVKNATLSRTFALGIQHRWDR